MPLDSRNVNALWASVLVETLARRGVRQAVISPGSRSTPLILALAAHPSIEAIPVLDERSAGFFALGLAKQNLTPVALVCTSGTAAANYFPAVIEARESAVPLLVLTADRPPELRASASGQTIDQQKLYGGFVEFFHELAVPGLDERLFRYLRQMAAHALARTRAAGGAPVHLNVPFRDPLAPLADDGAAARLHAAIDWTQFFAHLSPPEPVAVESSWPAFPPDARGIIVAGPSQPADVTAYVDALGRIAQRLGWPVLADGLSPVRNYADRVPNVVTTYDLILRNSSVAARLLPDTVLCLGGWPAGKVLRGWLEASGATIHLVTERRDNRDALHGQTRQLVSGLASFAAALPEVVGSGPDPKPWAACEQQVRDKLDAWLAAEEGLFEPKAAWLLARHLPAGTPLILANSMPVRDVEYVWPPGNGGIRPFCNRGANGIDGTLSTALGVTHGAGRPAVLLTGDLALLHDSNGFLLRPRVRGSLTVVVVNNNGGGIFEHLPIAAFEPPFEEFFATPQTAEIATLCVAYGIEHVPVRDWRHFADLVSKLPPTGIRVLELRTDRKRDAKMRKQWWTELAGGLR